MKETYCYHIVHSPDDGGYYAEVWDEKGKDINLETKHAQGITDAGASGIYQTAIEAKNAVIDWIIRHNHYPLPR